LHYIAANGIEDERQISPSNAVLIAETLLKAGADVDACAETYGGGSTQTTLNLLVSSMYAATAGIQVALVATLLNFGAAIDGLEDDCSPLLTALVFHCAEAAEGLVRRGARVDTVVAAAALGRQDLVESFLDKADGNSDLPLALVWAAMHRRSAVVELLLREGVDPRSQDQRGWTALHWASYYGYPEIVDLLLCKNAPLEAENEFGGTPLNQTIWTTVHERLLPDHPLILRTLVNSGAKIDPVWLDADLRPPLDPRVAAALRASN
jgi:ankyrin repeat protein